MGSEAPVLRTPRLVLRALADSHRAGFMAMNADPEVMAFMPRRLGAEDGDALVERIRAQWREHGFGVFAVEVPGVAPFAGFVGLAVPQFEGPFTPCVEIGWRFAKEFWGQGYAHEAAQAVLRFGFETVGLDEILSWTVQENVRSWHLMERLGMTRDAASDFDHPNLPVDSPLRAHVVYRLRAEDWRARAR